MSWSITVHAPTGFGISKVSWKYSSQTSYTEVDAGLYCIEEDEIQDNIKVNLKVTLESGYDTAEWQISRGSSSTTQTGKSITVSKGSSTSVMVMVTGVETPPSPTYYDVYARKSTYDSDGIASVNVSPSEVEEGDYAHFTATLNTGYLFLCWATKASLPTQSDIVSEDADFYYRIWEDTTLYAYAYRSDDNVSVVIVQDGTWVPTVPVVVKTVNGVKRWRTVSPAVVKSIEWKHN